MRNDMLVSVGRPLDADRAVDDESFRQVVEAFYARIRVDPQLGPVFNQAIADWGDHHRRLTDFWHSLMLTSGRYKGNPVALHFAHAPAMTPENFDRWLTLWQQTTDALMPSDIAQAMQAKAARVAESLQLAILYRRRAS